MKKKSKIALLGIFFLFVQIWACYHIFSYPYMGISIYSNEHDQIVVEQVDNHSAGVKLGIQPEDVIVEVNGDSPRNNSFVQRFGTVDQADAFTVIRNGERVEAHTQSLTKFSVYDIYYLFAELTSLALAYMIYIKVTRSPSSLYLSAILLTLAVIFMNMGSSVRGDPLGKYFICAGILVMPILMFQFIRAFMADKANIVISAKWLKPVTGMVSVFLVAMLSIFMDTAFTYPIYLWSKIGMMLFGLVGILANIHLLVYLYIQNRKKNKATVIIIKSISLALVCAVAPLVFLSLIPEICFGHAWVNALYTSYFLFLLPISFIRLLMTRRLYDIDQIVRRVTIIGLFALVPSLSLSAVVKLIMQEDIQLEKLTLCLLMIWVIISTTLYLLEYWNTRMEKVLFPRNYYLKKVLQKIAKHLGTITTYHGIRDYILFEVVNALELQGAAIAFHRVEGIDIIASGNIDEEQVKNSIVAPSLTEKIEYICFEISRHAEHSSYFIVTSKKSGAMLGQDDVNWLQLVLSYLGVAMENVQLIRKLDDKVQHLSSLLPTEEEAEQLLWFQKLLVDYQDQERVRLAMDLHDTTMQDLFFLKRSLQLTPQMSPSDMEEHVGKLSDYIDRINRNLRQSCFELHPHLLKEIGLVGTLQKLFQVERKLNDFQIHFISFGDKEMEEQEMELKRNVFRTVQELLSNAKKYSSAANVRFSLSLEENVMYLEYMDDGIGFDPAKPVVREIGSNGMGIRQIKTRIAAMGGSCELHSKAGEGVHFEAHFPATRSPKGKQT